MLVATWNVNSVKARHDRVMSWLDKVNPDVLCLQELKMTDEAFPYESFEERGYHCAVHGQKTWNGVAIISRDPSTNIRKGMGDDDPQSRLISAEIQGVTIFSAYFPNGKSVGTDKWQYKLEWMQRLQEYLVSEFSASGDVLLCGDFNIAPVDDDVAKPEKWRDSVLCHSKGREALEKIRSWGFVDTMRLHEDGPGPFSWWDYRRLSFPKGDGLRIDHIFASQSMATRCGSAYVDREERKGQKPSDHAPVLASFT